MTPDDALQRLSTAQRLAVAVRVLAKIVPDRPPTFPGRK